MIMGIFKKRNNIDGKRFGRLTVLRFNGLDKWGQATWLVKCDCGCEKVVGGNNLVSGNTKSCSCLQVERTTQTNTTHNKSRTRLYKTWISMKSRCQNLNDTEYLQYGGRGINVCAEWNKFLSFLQWAEKSGYNDNLTIDRINNNGNYEPGNCRWTTMEVQSNNKRNNRFVEYNGETKTVTQLAKELEMLPSTLIKRLNRGWSIERAAVTKPRLRR